MEKEAIGCIDCSGLLLSSLKHSTARADTGRAAASSHKYTRYEV